MNLLAQANVEAHMGMFEGKTAIVR